MHTGRSSRNVPPQQRNSRGLKTTSRLRMSDTNTNTNTNTNDSGPESGEKYFVFGLFWYLVS